VSLDLNRGGRRETIFRVSGTILEDTAQEVDPVEVDGNGFLKM
jgi:hypothetical protein